MTNTALDERVEPDVAEAFEENASRRPWLKLVLILGGIVVALIAGWFVFGALFGSGASPNSEGLVVPASQRGAAPATAPAAPGVPQAANDSATSSAAAVGRNPFAPVVPGKSSADPVPQPTVAAVVSQSAAASAITVQMVSLTPTSATLTVAGKSYTATVGQTFATDFKVYGIFGTQCAGVLFGTQSVPLCIGDVRTLSK